MQNISEFKDDYDWQQVFGFADGTAYNANGPNVSTTEVAEKDTDTSPFNMDDVAYIIGSDDGENDGASWIMAGVLKDKRFFFVAAGCDYTGWD